MSAANATGEAESRPLREGFRTNYGVDAGLTAALGRRDSASLGASASRTDYVDTDVGISSTTAFLSSGWNRRLTPRLAGGLDASLTGLASEDALDTRSLSAAIRAGGAWEATPRLGFSARIGPSLTWTESEIDEAVTPGVSAAVSAAWAPTPRDAWSLSFDQGIDVDDDGAVVNASRLGLRLRRNLTERTSAALAASVGLDVPIDAGAGAQAEERLFASVSPSVAWRLTPEASLDLGYRWRFEDAGGVSGARGPRRASSSGRA